MKAETFVLNTVGFLVAVWVLVLVGLGLLGFYGGP